MKIKFINWLIKVLKVDTNQISDGYHTYKELYNHRNLLFILLMKYAKKEGLEVWCSKKHSDSSSYDGCFVAGINKEKGKQITYHINNNLLYEVNKIAECLDKAPEWDGHDSIDVIKRLYDLVLFNEIL